MFGTQPFPRNERCVCGRDPADALVTRFSSITGTYSFHRCACGVEWTERVANPDGPEPACRDVVLEAHQHFKDFHGLVRTQAATRANARLGTRPGPVTHGPATSR
jgi:hypothetical protein